MKQYFAVRAFAAGFSMFLAAVAWSHSGGLDSAGGHSDRSTGEYHCHRSACGVVAPRATQPTPASPSTELAYRRSDWPHWQDSDGDCMNTRHEMLALQATGPVTLSPDGCLVSRGHWLDPFSGKLYTQASDLDVDHIVPLAWTHEHGGANWPRQQKARFANDPENLLVVDDGLNQAKGARGPDTWLPPNRLYRCAYLARWALILNKYQLSLSDPEAHLFGRAQRACRD